MNRYLAERVSEIFPDEEDRRNVMRLLHVAHISPHNLDRFVKEFIDGLSPNKEEENGANGSDDH